MSKDTAHGTVLTPAGPVHTEIQFSEPVTLQQTVDGEDVIEMRYRAVFHLFTYTRDGRGAWPVPQPDE